MKLIIGNKKYSSWSLRIWFLMKKLNLSFEEVKVWLFQDDYQNQIHSYANSNTVPILIDAEFTIWDTLSIAQYLIDEYPHILPSDKKAKAHCRSICAEMHSSFQYLRNEMPMNVSALNRKLEISQKCQENINRIFILWNEALANYSNSQGWLYGDFSVADAFFAPVVLRFNSYQVSITQQNIQNYIHKILNDNHIQNWMSQGKAEKYVIAEEEVGIEQ